MWYFVIAFAVAFAVRIASIRRSWTAICFGPARRFSNAYIIIFALVQLKEISAEYWFIFPSALAVLGRLSAAISVVEPCSTRQALVSVGAFLVVTKIFTDYWSIFVVTLNLGIWAGAIGRWVRIDRLAVLIFVSRRIGKALIRVLASIPAWNNTGNWIVFHSAFNVGAWWVAAIRGPGTDHLAVAAAVSCRVGKARVRVLAGIPAGNYASHGVVLVRALNVGAWRAAT